MWWWFCPLKHACARANIESRVQTSHAIVVRMPSVEICYHRLHHTPIRVSESKSWFENTIMIIIKWSLANQGCEGNFCFPRQLRFREICHADHWRHICSCNRDSHKSVMRVVTTAILESESTSSLFITLAIHSATNLKRPKSGTSLTQLWSKRKVLRCIQECFRLLRET